jgi:hypothetical protein
MRSRPTRAVIDLGEGAKICVKRPRADFIVDLGAYLAPMLRRAFEAIEFDALDSSVERDPRHHLRMGEMAALAAHLPDAVIGITPDRLEMIEQRALKFPEAARYCRRPARAWCSASITSP